MNRLGPTPRAQRLSQAWVITLFYGAMLALALGIGKARGHVNVFVVASHSQYLTGLPLSAAIGLGIGGAAAFCTRLATSSWQWARVLHQEFHALVYQITVRDIFLLALASSVAEEAFFRGALQPLVGVVLQSVLFSALHFRPRARFLPWTMMSLAVGLLFGWLTQWRGDLLAAIVAHFTVNALNLTYISRTELRA